MLKLLSLPALVSAAAIVAPVGAQAPLKTLSKADVEHSEPVAKIERLGDQPLRRRGEAGPVLGERRRLVVPEVHET